MALDMAKMKAKMDQLQNKGSGGGGSRNLFWRPEDGDQTIRILPTADGDPFKSYFFHYNLGKNAGFLSPKRNFGEDDPLNDFVSSLFQEGTPESTDLAKKLMAKQRFFSPVIVRGEEEKGVRIWGYGKQVYEQLLTLYSILNTVTSLMLILVQISISTMVNLLVRLSPRRNLPLHVRNHLYVRKWVSSNAQKCSITSQTLKVYSSASHPKTFNVC